MFAKILIANRGEIAVRVIKTANKMGIRTVAVYSDADKNALHVSMADEAVHIGPSPSQESYLNIKNVIQAALKTDAEAIHPGYGFLSENAEFCRACDENGLVFIGPPVKAIEAMGSKASAKSIMENANVPLVPGYHGSDQNPQLLKQAAEAMDYPVFLKAVAGGGGKGMRQVWRAEEFDDALEAAKREALASFGNDDMLVEKYLTQPRHIEFQIFCDQYGGAVYLFERDCSVQRRHQKVVEEAPAPGMTEKLRKQMGKAAVRAAQAINYEGAGTVEFLLDSDGSFFFMEMNTRLQVEHPVTEMISGLDLVEWQIRVAASEPLPLSQDQLTIKGHALEARIYAEDPYNDFLPETGELHYFKTPEESQYVRVDTGVVAGDEVSIYYDPMIAKLITWDENRDRAIDRLTQALEDYRVVGLKTNIQFLHKLVSTKPFINAELNTGFIDKHQGLLFEDETQSDQQLLEKYLPIAALYLSLKQEKIYAEQYQKFPSPWNALGCWRLNQSTINQYRIVLNEQPYDVLVEELENNLENRFCIKIGEASYLANGKLKCDKLTSEIDGHREQVAVFDKSGEKYSLFDGALAVDFEIEKPDYAEDQFTESYDANFTAPMTGTVVDVLVSPGDKVEKGQGLMILEAMKMEQTIQAPQDGFVKEVFYQAGDFVDSGKELLSFQFNDTDT
jgi:3-methylcrotonyl-CoA carboxylase alpha subunit